MTKRFNLCFKNRLGLCVQLFWLTSAACAGNVKSAKIDVIGFELAQVLVAHHAYEEATPLLQRALAEDPNNPRTHTMLGLVLRDKGQFDQAEKELFFAYHLNPDDVDTLTGLGVLYDLQGKHAEAWRWHTRALAMSNGTPDVYNNLGFSKFVSGDTKAAIVYYKEALSRDPSFHRVYNNLGFAEARLGNFEAALRAFKQAGPKAAALNNLALAYQMHGRANEAEALFNEALLLDKGLISAKRNLDHLLARRKETHNAAQ